MEEAFYPTIGAEEHLPVCIYGIGRCDYQQHVILPEGSPLPQIHYCTGGEGILILKHRKYEIYSHVAFFLPANCPYEYYTKDNLLRDHWITFGGQYYPSVLKELCLTKPIVIKNKHHDKLHSYWLELYECIQEQSIIGNMLASGHLYRYLLEYAARYQLLIQGKEAPKIEIQPVLDYIDAHFSEDIALSDLANLLHITPQYLCKLFRQQLNMRPVQYITKRRIEEAKQLLLQNRYTTSEIALRVGFHDTSYFCRLFRETEHMTTSDFLMNVSN